jgi:hypothetical protein
MAQLTIPEIIDLGDISVSLSLNYQARGQLFGPRKAYTAGNTIALVTDALRWQWDGFPDIKEVRAQATITIDTIGDTGQIITVFVNDPILGNIALGSYTLTDLDTTTDIIAANLQTELALNSYGYLISVLNSVITINAPEFYGALINGVVPYCTITTINFLSTESDDRLITENNLNIITE